tara:strand:- start:5754 stop:6209 length:456 start_codon:yes stop_codon:yes gene_type:complete
MAIVSAAQQEVVRYTPQAAWYLSQEKYEERFRELPIGEFHMHATTGNAYGCVGGPNWNFIDAMDVVKRERLPDLIAYGKMISDTAKTARLAITRAVWTPPSGYVPTAGDLVDRDIDLSGLGYTWCNDKEKGGGKGQTVNVGYWFHDKPVGA